MFSIAGNHLTEALRVAAQAAAARSPLHILTHIRVEGEAGAGSITLTGSDGYITAMAIAPASVGPDDVDVCVPTNKLQAIAGMSAAAIIFAKKDDKVVARAGSCRLTVPTIPGASFPVPQVNGVPIADFEAPGLTEIIPTVAFAIAGQKVHDKPFLRNLWLESDGSAIHVVGCDGFMLAANCLPIECALFGVPVTSEGATLLAAVGAERFEVYEHHVVGSRDGVRVICNRPTSRYFEWRRLIPVPDQYVTFARDDLLKVCPLHKIFDENGVIHFEQDGDLCSITISNNVQAVDADVELKARGEESHLEGSFDGPQLLRLLGQVKTEKVSLSWADGKNGACLLQDGSWRGLLAPLRV